MIERTKYDRGRTNKRRSGKYLGIPKIQENPVNFGKVKVMEASQPVDRLSNA